MQTACDLSGNPATPFNIRTVNKILSQCAKTFPTFSAHFPINSYSDLSLKSALKCNFTIHWYIRVVQTTYGSFYVVPTCRFVFTTSHRFRCLVGNYVSKFMPTALPFMTCTTMVFRSQINCNAIVSGPQRMLGHV